MHKIMRNFSILSASLALCTGFFLLVNQSHAAENWKGLISSQYPIGFEISPKEACENAEEQAKLDAMSLAGCEKLTFKQFETCESSDDAERCAFFQETLNAYDNCFVAKYKLLERNTNKLDLNQNQVCEVAAEINIRSFKSQLTFIFQIIFFKSNKFSSY